MIFVDNELALFELTLLVDGGDDGELVFDEDIDSLMTSLIVVAFVFMLDVDELAVFGVEKLDPLVGVSIKVPFLHLICESLVIV
jgi:hypothetical protein